MASVEQALQSFRPITRRNERLPESLFILLFLLGSSIFLFADATVPPVALQDEARNAVNAIEMYISGHSLITTFNFQPDLWNTKPPLLIWLMSASMSVFGPSDLAIRLPSMLTAMGTLCCTLLFVRRVTGSLATAVGAASILLLSPSFFGEHGARTADFDGPLAFFVTAALQLVFFEVHRARPGMRRMFAMGGLIAAAAMTKSIAAFIPVTGVLLYLLAVGRLKRALSFWHRYAVAGAAAAAPLLAFYALRETAAPGYLSAVIYNDIVGRFSETLIGSTSPFYYVTALFSGWFVAGPFLVAAPLALKSCSAREKLLLVYAASIAGASLLVYSAASNRALQYALPMLPWLSIVAVLTLRYLIKFVADLTRDGRTTQALILSVVFVLAGAPLIYGSADWRYRRFPERQYYPEASYGILFAELSGRGVTQLAVVDPGVMHFGDSGYVPLLRWNALIWQQKGMKIIRYPAQPAGTQVPLASCEPVVFDRWSGPALEKIGSCAVLWRLSKAHDRRPGRRLS